MMFGISRFCSTLMAAVLSVGILSAAPSSDQDTPKGGIVIQWNRAALNAIRATNTPPPTAARNLAILSLAVFDAVNAVEQKYHSYLGKAKATADTSSEAAAIAAANWVLTTLFPSQMVTFDQLMADELAKIPEGPQKKNGIILGREGAKAILSARAKDGSDNSSTYRGSHAAGHWQPTQGQANKPPVLSHWSSVAPFALTKPSQFRPAPPLDHGSEGFANEMNDVKDIGAKESKTRTSEQTEIAKFWDEGPGTATPPGQWNEIAATVVEQKGNPDLLETARLFALLNIGLADSGIAAWECKYRYNGMRPETAIRSARATKNKDINNDPGWASLLKCPHSPEYVSGNSAYSGAAAVILSTLLGDNNHFTVGSDATPSTIRSFNSFSQAAEESGLSRVYGGVLTNRGNEIGEQLGRDVGRFVVDNFLGAPAASNGKAND